MYTLVLHSQGVGQVCTLADEDAYMRLLPPFGDSPAADETGRYSGSAVGSSLRSSQAVISCW